mmetsp:Transcript_9259/g.28777  ORF Transcript_9259/g.28777 Transcript_9259/m.28777 type:complete len:534 (+) Transcript_9259:1349-2950(+)
MIEPHVLLHAPPEAQKLPHGLREVRPREHPGELVGREADEEVDALLVVVLALVDGQHAVRLVGGILDVSDEVVSPETYRQLRDLHGVRSLAVPQAAVEPPPPGRVDGTGLIDLHRAREAVVPGHEFPRGLSADEPLQGSCDLQRVVVGAVGGPASADAHEAVEEGHGHHGQQLLGFHELAILPLWPQHIVVFAPEDRRKKLRDHGVDVARGGVLGAPVEAGPELATGLEQVHVVRADEGLGEADNGLDEGVLTVVVTRRRGDQARDLGDLALLLQTADHVQDLALRRLEAVNDGGDRPDHVGLREQYQLLVHKVCVTHLRLAVIHELSLNVAVDPLLAVIRALLVECKVNGLVILCAVVTVLHPVRINRSKVLLRLLGGACTQTLVILDLEALAIVCLLLPRFVLRHGVEAHQRLALRGLHDGGEELLEEAGDPGQGGPPRVDEVDQQALDVGAVVILICHDHDGAVAQALELGVVLAVEVQADDLDDVLDLLVRHHLLQRRIAHVEQLAAKREDTKPVPPDDAEACHSQGLG